MSRAADIIHASTDAAQPITLAEVMDQAALQTRIDHKFLLTPDQFSELIDWVRPDFNTLEIDRKRVFAYESTYFDTPDLANFRAHRQGRRQRIKVRTRSYLDSGECSFEVKLKGLRGATVKERIAHDLADRAVLNRPARAFLQDQVWRAYGYEVPEMEPALRSDYHRATFVNTTAQERMTCDIDLSFTNDAGATVGPDLVLVETKSAQGKGLADQVLAAMGIRPVKISKYCIGVALVHPQLAANPWNRLLRRQFGWQRAA